MSDQDENVTAVSPTVDPFATSPVDSSSEDAAIAVELDEILEEAVVAVEEAIVEAIEAGNVAKARKSAGDHVLKNKPL